MRYHVYPDQVSQELLRRGVHNKQGKHFQNEMPDQGEIGQVLFKVKKRKPWKNGFFKMGDICLGLVKVHDTRQTFIQLKFLECEEEAEQEMNLKEGEEGRVKITLMGETIDGMVREAINAKMLRSYGHFSSGRMGATENVHSFVTFLHQ